MKKLYRSRDDKWIGGVCGGISDYTGVDANLIRLLVVVGTVLGFGSLILAYIIAWVLIPARPAGPPAGWGQATDSPTTPSETPPPSQ
jgi:phage shock protein C